MKKLLFILLGLVSSNIYAADPTYDATKGALQNNPALCSYGYNPNCASGHQKEAIRTCERGGSNAPCRVVAWGRNGCIAAAQGSEGKKSRIFSGIKKPGLAEAEALRKCQAAGVPQCKIVVSEACSLPKY